jgi:hypothetical protein
VAGDRGRPARQRSVHVSEEEARRVAAAGLRLVRAGQLFVTGKGHADGPKTPHRPTPVTCLTCCIEPYVGLMSIVKQKLSVQVAIGGVRSTNRPGSEGGSDGCFSRGRRHARQHASAAGVHPVHGGRSARGHRWSPAPVPAGTSSRPRGAVGVREGPGPGTGPGRTTQPRPRPGARARRIRVGTAGSGGARRAAPPRPGTRHRPQGGGGVTPPAAPPRVRPRRCGTGLGAA